ncbi:MAG: potassium channel family protein [Planctomycetota bacterium]
MPRPPFGRPRVSPMRSHALLVLLTIEFFVAPAFLSQENRSVWVLLHAVFQALIFVFLIGIVRHRMLAGICTGLLIAGMLLSQIGSEPGGWAANTADLANATATMIVLAVALKRFFVITDVTAATISSALAVYLIAGIFWSLLYTIIESASPGSFFIGGDTVSRTDLHYFSYVTMTTLGYGDVVPRHGFARSCALAQALLGQVFIAVIVGRLVAIYVSRGSTPPAQVTGQDDEQ